MKAAVIFYHRNIGSIYDRKWIDQCVDSMKNQTYTDFDVYELNYGQGKDQYCAGKFKNYVFLEEKFENHIGAMNYLYSMLFKMGYDVVFNTNMDDYFDCQRVEKQLAKIKEGYDIVSSNFVYINDKGESFKVMNVSEKGDIGSNLSKDHNVIAHPCVAMSRNFWDDDLHYNDLIGKEDLDLWKRASLKGKRFFILPDHLLMYRIHDAQITSASRVKKKVNLLVIASNKYTRFLKPLLDSADKYFLDDCEVNYCIFTDKEEEVSQDLNRPCHIFHVDHGEWPRMTLYRFHFFTLYMSEMPECDYFAYIDADTLFKAPITSEVLGDRVPVQHCGFVGKRGPYETNPKSKAYVGLREGKQYYGGGFWIFSSSEFVRLSRFAVEAIDTDKENGIVPIWHDESVLNRFLIYSPPTKVLDPGHHYPESRIDYYKKIWGRDYQCKILLLDKNHNEVREAGSFVTMKTLGTNGRLGNQLFQYASTMGIAHDNNAELKLPYWNYRDYFDGPFHHEGAMAAEIKEREFSHSNYSDLDYKKGVNFKGYFQSEKYWASIKDKVLSTFKFKKDFIVECLSQFPEAFKKETIAVHIRRGDYVGNKSYVNLSPKYYILALQEHFPKWHTCNLIFFSDDIEYCKIHFECLENAYFSTGKSEIEDLCLMSQCKHHIIANSSFSWWGAYLSDKGGKVVRPADHFSGGLKTICNTKDLYPEKWIPFSDEGKKIGLRYVTFMIPFKYDSKDRLENFNLCIDYLTHYFDTNIIVCEIGNKLPLSPKYRLLNYHSSTFHRTKMLNVMARQIETPTIANWDCDVFIAPAQIVEAAISAFNNDMVMPYDWRFARIPRTPEWVNKMKTLDVGVTSGERHNLIGFREGDKESWGGAVIFNREAFFRGGMENENFISFGPEDSERRDRFSKLGFKLHRIKGPLYHLNHVVGLDSGKKHAHFAANRAEYERVRLMTKEELQDYVKTWSWRKV